MKVSNGAFFISANTEIILKAKSFIALSFLFVVFPAKVTGQEATDSLHQLLKRANGIHAAEINLDLARHFLVRNPDSAIYYSRKAITIAEKRNNPIIIIRSYAHIAEAYQKQGEMKEAISFGRKA
jgi:hypothetical protein